MQQMETEFDWKIQQIENKGLGNGITGKRINWLVKQMKTGTNKK